MKNLYFILVYLFLQGCDQKVSTPAALNPSELVKITAQQAPTEQIATPNTDGYTQIHPEQAHMEQGTHSHGLAKLHLVLEGKILNMQMNIPSADAVGFEHAPINAEEQSALQDALRKLQSPDNLFSLPLAADCSLKAGAIESALLNAQAVEHADFDVVYQWQCAKPEQLTTIAHELFSYFTRLEKLYVEYLIHNKQGASELKRGETRLIF